MAGFPGLKITGVGHAIALYARRLNRGEVRHQARINDSLVFVTAFKDKMT